MAEDLFNEQQKFTHRVQGLVNAFGDDIAKTLEGALEEVEGKLAMLSARAAESPSYVRRKQYLEKQREQIQKVLGEIYTDMGIEIQAKAVELARAMPGLIHKMILNTVPVGFEFGLSVPQLSKKEVLAWWESSQIEGSFFNDWMKKLESNTVDRVVSESRRSLVLHEDPIKTGKRIQQALDVSRRSAETLLNTALQEAVNYGELQYYQENAERIPKVLFVAELDRRTCPLCRELDQTVYPTEEAAKSKPPLHANCRCRLFPVFAAGDIYGIDEAKRVSRKETNPRTVKHRDGSSSTEFTEMEAELVPFKTTYNEWMTSMVNGSAADQAFAREALGPTRFNLIRSGELRMDSLYYQGRLRTIKELEELI